MIRTGDHQLRLSAGVLAPFVVAAGQAASAAQPAAQLTAADAAPFIGNSTWICRDRTAPARSI